MSRWAQKHVIQAACIILALFPVSLLAGSGAFVGVSDGKVNCYVGGKQVSISVPDSFTVVDIQSVLANRTLVVANIRHSEDGVRASYLSEVWLFAPPLPVGRSLSFDDRKVLVSLKTKFGERMQVCRRTVNSPVLTAVQVLGWESCKTLLFDQNGEPLPFDTKLIAEKCACGPSYIRPLLWLEEAGSWRLVCTVGEEGGMGPFILVYNPTSGDMEVDLAIDL